MTRGILAIVLLVGAMHGFTMEHHLQSCPPYQHYLLVTKQKVFTSGYEEYFINVDYDEGINGNLFVAPQGMPYFHYGKESQILTPCNSTSCSLQNDQCYCFTNFNFTLGNIVQV
uniref:Uncharacterized protein n=1 Tax=Acrobeloides nanus TaxID=290746 RepID=A0A914CTL8_9BILA